MLAVAAVLASIVLTGCAAEDPLAAQARAGDNKNYIAGDGSVAEYAPEARGEPVDVQGTLFDGSTVNSTDWAGDVVVLNVWYAACAPCRAEAPTLAALSTRFTPDGVRFYGINVRDEKPTADAFERTFGITYPSFEDRDGKLLLSLTQYVPPQAVPTTLVLDRDGRVAARILGLAEESTLRTLITDALAQPSPDQPAQGQPVPDQPSPSQVEATEPPTAGTPTDSRKPGDSGDPGGGIGDGV
ncbi:TlpA family protein disulfide reductase [Arthrobacter echini]|uniref:TlpA family protein disulfide reductase n=2 Tax=Arthrobacter echini TaxID=1529066 RepID=A0A4S5E0J7_9MICC|nr:TlpA family protein disulfide reductase [Arthrobacter echini]TYC97138.1 TlpA family protein disulfide reductase [Arthrobacter echini]